eukprot:GHRQ01011098.1.p2 GENE.GHRQ01011098.1~~GHRQ01011098.1.p2  ORF type:complete len:136 (-),score=37.88 GHRQ01011098.1:1430-1837(-)
MHSMGTGTAAGGSCKHSPCHECTAPPQLSNVGAPAAADVAELQHSCLHLTAAAMQLGCGSSAVCGADASAYHAGAAALRRLPWIRVNFVCSPPRGTARTGGKANNSMTVARCLIASHMPQHSCLQGNAMDGRRMP